MSTNETLLRARAPHQHHRVTYVELFFDLVFVFAITQISHTLLAHFTPLGVLQTTILFLAVWWVWIYTSWITNWLDPERTPVRVMLFGLMVAGLLLSTSIPKAFESRGLAFALAFVVMQVGRSAFTFLSIPKSKPGWRMNLLRITCWLACSGVFWIAGGLAEGETRLILWIVAVAIEYCGPVMRFRFPGLGATPLEDWEVEGGHMAERCALFIIIALGESLVVTGATFASAAWTAPVIMGFVVALIGSIAMWWVYFHIGAEAGAEHISHAKDTGRLARLAYTYLHLPIVAGIVVSAVGDELLLAHPDGHADTKTILTMIGGPLLFLIGTILFKRSIRGIFQLSHMVGIGLLIVLIPFAHSLSPLLLSSATTVIMLIVATWEAISLGSRTLSDEV
ncbi:low temperature requirement protein LtrA [Afipia massiliensis]|uniref:Low temperature requirement protein LtrA n=1 Tax=Afipia massiliensis TaxID=211460 RepID=A0A840N6T2_9BRAD|nr:low temperature requirement protein LtrA [Afipia massiliensis]